MTNEPTAACTYIGTPMEGCLIPGDIFHANICEACRAWREWYINTHYKVPDFLALRRHNNATRGN